MEFIRISKCVRNGNGGIGGGNGGKEGGRYYRHRRGGSNLPLRNALVDISTRVFDELTAASMPLMTNVNLCVLSNLTYSFGLAGFGRRIGMLFEDREERAILDVFTDAAINKIHALNMQDL